MAQRDPISLNSRSRAGLRVATIVLSSMTLMACTELRTLSTEGHKAEVVDRETGAAPVTEPATEQAPDIAYNVSIIGVPEPDLMELLEGSSQLLVLKPRPPATVGALRQRANGDVERLQTALRSEGFYGAEVRYEIDRDVTPIEITVDISTGTQYLLAAYDIAYETSPPPAEDARPSLDDLGLHIGMPARAPTILAAQRALLETLSNRGYPLAKVLDRKTTVDHGTTTMTAALTVDAGPFARFGPVTIEGLDSVEEAYVRDLIAWTEGERYDRTKVEATRRALSNSGLFASTAIDSATQTDPQDRLPMTITLAEGKHRSIGFGANYSTDEGFGGEVFWEHRNFFGRNERLRLTLTAAQIEQILEADFRKPNFLQRDQVLLTNLAVSNRDTTAFNEQSVTGTLGLERPLGENWQVSGGVSGEYSVLEDVDSNETFQLFGLPVRGARDTTDDPLNPTQGTRFNLALTPYIGQDDDDSLLFGVATTSGAAYYALDNDRRFILAGRAKIGTILGEETDSIPANKRFYAGGGGSVRGFEFQSVGPLDENDSPLGGRSLLELNTEVRVRVTERIGLVPFLDGGTVVDSSQPDFTEPIRWAAGLGARYFSDFGPIRLDVAVPVNRRNIDDSYQFYISLGQAF